MNRTVIALIAVLLIGGGLYLVATEYSDESQDAESTTAAAPAAKQSVKFEFSDAEKLVGHLDPKQRRKALANPALFRQVINNEIIRQAKLMAARDSGLEKNKTVAYLMQRQSEDALIGVYTRAQLQSAGMPKGFPSEKQILAYYNNNKARFVLEKRLPVWQIFWRIPDGASEIKKAEIMKKASAVSASIKAGKQEFHAAALKHSEHQVSRLKGGFMGMLQVSELAPDIKDKLLALNEGKVSSPITRKGGVHVFLRGAIAPQTQLALDEVSRPAIINALKKNVREQQQHKLNQLVAGKYAGSMKGVDVEKWRTKMVQSSKQAKPVSAKK